LEENLKLNKNDDDDDDDDDDEDGDDNDNDNDDDKNKKKTLVTGQNAWQLFTIKNPIRITRATYRTDNHKTPFACRGSRSKRLALSLSSACPLEGLKQKRPLNSHHGLPRKPRKRQQFTIQ